MSKLLICPKHTTKAQWLIIHWSTNQTPHFPHFDFKFNPLNGFPNRVAIFWTCIFHVHSHSMARLFIAKTKNKNWFLELPLILFIFKRGKNQKENHVWLLIWKKNKNKKIKTSSWTKNVFGGQVVYLRRYVGKP